MERRQFISLTTASLSFAFSTVPAFAEVQAELVRVTKDRTVNRGKSYNYKRVADPTGSAPTRRVERFELRGGDCSSEGDCTPRSLNGRQVSRARTERVLFTDLQKGEAGVFSYQVYFPSNEYNVVKEVGSTFGQLLASFTRSWDSDSGPIFSLDTDTGSRPALYVQMTEADTFEGRNPNEKSVTIGAFDTGSQLFDRWIKIEAYFLLSDSVDGFIEFRIDGRSTARLNGKTILPNGGVEVRYGIYQTGTNAFPGGADAIPAQVAYFSDVQVLRIVS